MSRFGNSGHDESLLSSMAARLRKVEEDLQLRDQQLADKDRQLHEARVSVGKEKAQDRLIVHLKKECTRAFQQIQEMEGFLADYGMILVGKEDEAYEEIPGEEEEEEENSVIAKSTWTQNESVADYTPDFNRILANIHELNILGGDGVGLIEKGSDGIARVTQPTPIPLTLYSNGLLMFEGPFRPYSEPQTLQMIKDFEDGYFPSELQARYPKGMPVKVKDLREKVYSDKRTRASFPGSGNKLSDAAKELAEIRGTGTPSEEDATADKGENTDFPQNQSVDRFLNKLPANVIRDGKIIDIRSSVGAIIGATNTENTASVEVAETAVVKQIQAGESTAGPISTLRVKLDGGTKTLIVKLRYSDTIADIRTFVDQHKKGMYEIRTTFPNQTYETLSESVEEAGLVPSATLHIRDL